MNKAVIYCRTANKDIDSQLCNLRSWAAVNAYFVVREYFDENVSGLKPYAEKPGLCRLINDLEVNSPDVVICESLDRISRKYSDLLEISKILNEKGVKIITLRGECL